jgi:hypothetical protein
MPDQQVYRCRRMMHPSTPHKHSRRIDSDNPWDGSVGTICHSPDPGPPDGWERHCAPDGTEYRFASADYTVDGPPPEPPRDTDVPNGESPEWPISECTYGHLDPPHYHVRMLPRTEYDQWNGAVHNNGGWQTEHGHRYAKGEHLPTPQPETHGASDMVLCDIDRHRTAPEPHWHVHPAGHPEGQVSWHSAPGWGAAHPTVYTDIPGTFTRRHELVTPTERESTMPDTFTPGDIVIATGGRHHNITADHLHLIAGPMYGDPEWSATVLSLGNEGHGWAYRGRTEGLAPEVATVLREESARGWNIDNRNLRLATRAEQRHLPREMEALQRRIRIAALGAEPVQECTIEACPSTPHRHSVASLTSNNVRHRLPGDDSIYIPLPGLWGKGDHTTTTTEESTTMYDLRMNGDHTIHRSRERVPSGTRGTALCGQTVARASRSPREWQGGDSTTLVECRTCFSASQVCDSADLVELHPLDRGKLAEHPSFTLHSIVGDRDGNNLVFGCQRFPMSVVADANGTMEFLPEGKVRATMPATASGVYVRVGDRSLPMSDINAYTTSIMGAPAPADPDAEVKAAIGAVIRGGHTPETRAVRSGEILTALRTAGFDVVKRDA